MKKKEKMMITIPESKVKHEPSATIGNTEDDHNYDSDSGSEVTARIEVDDGDDDLVRSDQASLDYGEADVSSNEPDVYAGTTFMSHEQSFMLSKVTHSLVFEQERISNPDGSDAFWEDLEGAHVLCEKSV
ncbi:unnamed protein product [Ambrosiozyma monospora]|uniref:Unnamed protein product n=1 Tax=Ambrosiozyma monospora TaxID=43982 RepID=A0ACB5TY48_AMBMO|nr:unnamed protein product [Ambrosiozyma monospora]